MRRNRPVFDKLRPKDYVLVVGLPVIFVAIMIWGIASFLVPDPAPDPVLRLKQGAVHPGMTEQDVLDKVGPPKSISEQEDGSFSFRYQSSRWSTSRTDPGFTEEDAFVDFSPVGQVERVAFETKRYTPDGKLK